MLIVAGDIDAAVVKLTRSDESGNVIPALPSIGTCSALITIKKKN